MGGRVVVLAGLLAFALAAAPAQGAARLKSFDSCAALVRYAGAHAPKAVVRPDVLPTTTAGPEQTTAGAERPAVDDVSTTNVQEAGVDEPDVVKSDGAHLLVIAGGTLHAIDARADPPRLVGSVALPAGSGHELLVHDGRALVISAGPRSVVPLPRPLPGGPETTVMPEIAPEAPPAALLTEVDVRDPAAMVVGRSLSVPGSLTGARLTGATARVVISSAPPFYAQPDTRGATEGWIPRATLAAPGGAPRSRALIGCRSVRRPARFAGAGLLSVLTVDVDRGLPAVDVDALMTDAETVYAAPRSLYVATRRFDAAASSATAIHRFATGQADRTEYRVSGSVPGHLLGQFALSEHDGVLRAATTTDPWSSAGAGESESFVTTLRERDGVLERVGQVGGIGRGERIYAVRFLGPVGYVVTFRQTDPLYTVDLADPAAPKVTGELALLGYSAYLHPLGEGRLLGVGQDADAAGRTTGAQVSLFDVSDPARPVRLAQRTLGPRAWTEAEVDHHAFLWWPATKLAVVPLAQSAFIGAVGLRVGRDSIDEVGRVGHDGETLRRSTVVGRRLFSLAEGGVQVSALDTLAAQGWIAFPESAPPEGVGVGPSSG